jgi:MFS family permease
MTTEARVLDPSRLLSPLRVSSAYRALMAGQLATQTAIWVLTVSAQVVMVQRGESTLVVALVQSAVTLPFLVFTIPSGVLADLVSRRLVLVVTNVAATVVGVVLTVSSAADALGAGLLLVLTFLLGLAWAVNAPSFTAIVPDVVPRDYIPAAGMLASINFNLARVVGPAVGGLVIAVLGPTVAFGLSTLGYAAFAVAALVADVPVVARSASRRFLPALRTGFRHVVNARQFRLLVVLTAAWFVTGSALFALLPVVALRELGLGPGQYGWVLALLGGGAVVGTVLLAPLRARVHATRFVTVMMPVFAVCLLGIGLAHAPLVLMVVLPVTGAAWTAVGAVLLSLGQQLLPGWVRARGMGYYLMASQGGMALGALLWGAVANRLGVTVAFAVAALAVVPTWIAALLGRFPEVTVLAEVPGWPLPDAELTDDVLDRRAHVAVTWRVPAELREQFLDAMADVRRSRRRTGGREWVLTSDVEQPDVYVESWTVDSWHDHLEQHEVRQSPEDAAASDAVRALVGPPVEIRHYVEVVG